MSQIQKETFKFLKQLGENNNKPWFEQHRDQYETARANFLDFNAALLDKMQKVDITLAGLDPKKSVFRINRDVRFSKDKSPYKSNMGTTLSKGGKNMQTAGYYFHLQPGHQTFAAAGSYGPVPETLQAIRQEIDYNYKDFSKILSAAGFRKFFDGIDAFDRLKTLPKGYSAENPAIELLKNRSFIVTKYFTDQEVLSPYFLKNLVACFKAAYPLVNFLNKAME